MSKKLSPNDFDLGSYNTEAKPTISGTAILLPAGAPIQEKSKFVYLASVEAMSKEAYHLNEVSFKGRLVGSDKAKGFDEEDFICVNDKHINSSPEFGFRAGLSDNMLYGYISDGDRVSEKNSYFKMQRLMTNDSQERRYTMKVHSFWFFGYLNVVRFVVDDILRGSMFHWSQWRFDSIPYYLSPFCHVFTSGWDPSSLSMTVDEIEYD